MLQEKAYAKLNLTLDILRRRPDGYHDLRMMMQSISLCDKISFDFNDSNVNTLHSNFSFLPCDQSNIVSKSAAAFFRETGIEPRGMEISLEKSIPVCAGMAGGSSDGAAMLRLLRRQFAPELPDEELCRIGAMVGSDVPFCIGGGTAVAEGRGELLRAVNPMPPCFFLLCKPEFSLSTPELFSKVNVRALRYHPDTAGMEEALRAGDLTGVCRRLYNVFEDVLPRRYRAVHELKRQMTELGAMGAAMTGSGPTVFGIFSRLEEAETAAEELRKTFRCVHVAQPVTAQQVLCQQGGEEEK